MIDEMPVFFIAAALSDGVTIVKDAKELRTKRAIAYKLWLTPYRHLE